VSRQHARFEVGEECTFVEDLGSRNGVLVNDERIFGRVMLKPGDRVRIGNQILTYLFGRSTGSWTEPPAPTRRFDALGVIGELAEKALGLGRFEEAERLIEAPLQQLTVDVKSGLEASTAALSKATDLAARLAVSTLKPAWIDRLVDLYMALGRPWPPNVIDSLYDIARKVSGVDRTALRNYSSFLKTAQLGPADRFLSGRIEGLERQLSSPR
jgi:hypothetical protein